MSLYISHVKFHPGMVEILVKVYSVYIQPENQGQRKFAVHMPQDKLHNWTNSNIANHWIDIHNNTS